MHAFAHITGGGLPDNLARVLPAHCDAVLRRGTWEEPRIFGEIQAAGDVADDEMAQVFNLGLGMVAVVPPGDRCYAGRRSLGRPRSLDRRRGVRRPRSGKYHP